MAEPQEQGRPYQVHASGVVLELIRQIQRQAEREGRGEKVLASLHHIYERLQEDPHHLGEALYRLPSLRLQMHTCAVRPLVVDFAVHLDKPLVFIKGVKLLSERDS